jgi:2-polyprenyl-6-methoxyphenol hydroxylase-like FAD-dependent oxidoreductase
VHATTPNLGQGGAQALEDALVLADAISVHGPGPRAFDVYQCVRQARAALVVRMSWWVGKAGHVHNPLVRRVRNFVMRQTPASMVRRQLDGIYTVATR